MPIYIRICEQHRASPGVSMKVGSDFAASSSGPLSKVGVRSLSYGASVQKKRASTGLQVPAKCLNGSFDFDTERERERESRLFRKKFVKNTEGKTQSDAHYLIAPTCASVNFLQIARAKVSMKRMEI